LRVILDTPNSCQHFISPRNIGQRLAKLHDDKFQEAGLLALLSEVEEDHANTS